MVAFAAALVLLQVEQVTYDPGKHVSLISQRLKEVQELLREADDKKVTAPEAARSIGRILGENRRLQGSLTTFLKNANKSQSPTAIRAVQLSGLFDAFLASAILGLDGDASSKELSVLLGARLARQIERKA